MAEFTLQALHDEIEADPLTLGYKEAGGAWKGDQAIADLINANNYFVDNISVQEEEVRLATTYEAYNNLSIDEQEWLRWITPGGGDLRVSADIKLQLTGRTLTVDGAAGTGNDNASFWAVADRSEMIAAHLPLIEVPGSRAMVLWGQGTVISLGQIGNAANL
jgi:hypothetical protein